MKKAHTRSMKAIRGVTYLFCSEHMGKNIADMFWFV